MPDVFSYGNEDDSHSDTEKANEEGSHTKKQDFYGQSKKLDNYWYLETIVSTFSPWNWLFSETKKANLNFKIFKNIILMETYFVCGALTIPRGSVQVRFLFLNDPFIQIVLSSLENKLTKHYSLLICPSQLLHRSLHCCFGRCGK